MKRRDPAREACEKLEAIELILNSRMYLKGEFFTARDAAQVARRDDTYTRRLLNDMALAGRISRVVHRHNKYVYRKIDNSLEFHKRSCWRHNHAIYGEIERERRGW